MNKASGGAEFERIQSAILDYLRAFEAVQQSILFHDVTIAQRELAAAEAGRLSAVQQGLEALGGTIEAGLAQSLAQALAHLIAAHTGFGDKRGWPEFATQYMASRRHQCQALEILYRHVSQLPLVEPYFRLPDGEGTNASQWHPPTGRATAPTGHQ